MVTLPSTAARPASITTFRVTPKSCQLSSPVAVKPTLVRPAFGPKPGDPKGEPHVLGDAHEGQFPSSMQWALSGAGGPAGGHPRVVVHVAETGPAEVGIALRAGLADPDQADPRRHRRAVRRSVQADQITSCALALITEPLPGPLQL
jgi:hypothetical protein